MYAYVWECMGVCIHVYMYVSHLRLACSRQFLELIHHAVQHKRVPLLPRVHVSAEALHVRLALLSDAHVQTVVGGVACLLQVHLPLACSTHPHHLQRSLQALEGLAVRGRDVTAKGLDLCTHQQQQRASLNQKLAQSTP